MNATLQILLLFTPFLLHLIHDVRQINGGTSPKHGRNLAILVVLSLGIGYSIHFWALPKVGILQYVFLAGAIHFAFFNYSLNFFRKPRKPFFYFGTGPFDSVCKIVISRVNLMGYLFLQAFLLVVAYMTYRFPYGH